MRFFICLFLCYSTAFATAARAADWTVGPGGELPFDFAHYEASAGEFRPGKSGVIYRAPLETGTFTLRGRSGPDAPWTSERVTVVPARIEVKWLGDKYKWGEQASVMTGGLKFPEYQVAWRVVFPNQADPASPLPVARITLRGDFKNEPTAGRKPARLTFDSLTKGRFVSSDLLYQTFFLELGSRNGNAKITQRYADASRFKTPPYFVYGRPESVSYSMLFGAFAGAVGGRIENKPVRGQTLELYSDTAYVLRWDAARRDWVSLVISSEEADWTKIKPLFEFSPVVVTSDSGIYRSRMTQRADTNYLLDGMNMGVTVSSLREVDDSQSEIGPDDPDFDGRLRAPGTPPPFPVFDSSHVAAMLRDIERGDNAALLRVGLLTGHFQTPVSANDALELVRRQLKSESALSPRWLLLQRLRAWGAWHQPHGGGTAMAVYAGVFGRSKDLIARGESELLGRVLEDWQSLVTGPYESNGYTWGAPATQANVAALETFLRLGFARQTSTFDNDNARYLEPDGDQIKRIEMLERDSTVAHDFWFFLGAGEVLAANPREPNPVKALERLEKARAQAPDNKKIRLRLYEAFDAAYNWRSQNHRGATPDEITFARISLSSGQLWGKTGDDAEVTPEKRAELEKQIADFEAAAQARKAAIEQSWAEVTRERIAVLGTGYNQLYQRLTREGESLNAPALALLQTMARQAPEREVLEVAEDLLGSQYYDANSDFNQLPVPDRTDLVNYNARRDENDRQRELDKTLHEQGEKLLTNYLAARRARTPKYEFEARLQLARFYLSERRSQEAALAVAAVAPQGKSFDDYRAAQKWIEKIMAG